MGDARRNAAILALERATRTMRDRASLLDTAAKLVAEALREELAEVSERQGEVLVVRASCGFGDGTRDQGVSRTPAGLAVTTEEAVAVDSIFSDRRFDVPRVLADQGVCACVCAPISTFAGVYGVLSVYTRRPRRFDPDEIAFVSACAGIVGLWLSAARAVEQLTVEDFLAIVSHDLRNPLSAIDAAMTLLERARTGEDALARAARVVPLVHRNVERMRRLIHDLLDLEALRGGGVALEFAEHCAATLLEDAVELMRPLASNTSHSLMVVDESESARVLCDRERILEVFSNLVGNALKFTPPGGRIELRAARKDDDICFEVRDTGRGIAASQLPHVFDRFFQGLGARTNGNNGAGLGLAIAKAIVEAHGGTIHAESTEGEGARFLFTLRHQPASRGRFTLQPPSSRVRAYGA